MAEWALAAGRWPWAARWLVRRRQQACRARWVQHRRCAEEWSARGPLERLRSEHPERLARQRCGVEWLAPERVGEGLHRRWEQEERWEPVV